MEIRFEQGSPTEPKGHAVVYFKDQTDETRVVATYLVVLPVSVDVAKYMPPFLSAQIGSIRDQDFSAFAFPPVPEGGHSVTTLKFLATIRGDDLLFAGSMDLSQTSALVELTNEIVQAYALEYNKFLKNREEAEQSTVSEPPGSAINEILYEFMGERDRLTELTKLVSRLRFAVDGQDSTQIKEVQDEVSILSKYLPERFAVSKLLSAASFNTNPGTELAHLYLERCYKLIDEDYVTLKVIEEKIQELEDATGGELPPQ